MISVVIPTHNRLDDLKRALKSVYKQTLLPSEIIVVDDGSTPAVPDNIFNGAPGSAKCLLLRNQEPKGGNFARNRGAEAATGEYIAFLDDDDTWASNKLALQFELMESKKLDLCYTGKQIITVDESLRELSKRYSFAYPKFDNLKKSIMRQNFIGTTSSIMVRKSCFDNVGRFDIGMPALQDYELYIRIIFAGCNVKGIDVPLVDYFIHKRKSAVSKSLVKSFNAVINVYGKHKNKDYVYYLLLNLFKLLLVKVIRGVNGAIFSSGVSFLKQI